MKRRLLHLSIGYILLTINPLQAGEIKVTGQGLSISNGSSITSRSRCTDFGTVAAAASSGIRHTFVIHNEGATALQFAGVSVEGAAFDLIGSHPGILIQPGGTKSFDIEFDPTSAGVKTGSVSIISDDSDENPYTFDIEGEGLGTPDIELRGRQDINSSWLTITKGATSGSTNRGTTLPDTLVDSDTSTVTFEIRNNGDAQITIDSITIDDSNFVAASVPSNVGVNQTETFTVVF